MKVIVNRPVEIDIKTLFVKARVRYPEDSMIQEGPDDAWGEDDANQPKMPCMSYIECNRRTSSWHWCPIIDIATGRIINWKQGVRASISYKVCDEFECEVKDSDNAIVASYNGYVLNFMAITDEGYGDYIYLDVNEDGFIENWSFTDSDFKEIDEAEY
jgi:hypothetical protein